MSASWGYEEHNGPFHWHKWFPIASSGSRQSPVDIKTSACVKDDKVKEVMVKYSPLAGLRLENTGSSWMVKMDKMTSSLSGGPLGCEYHAAQMHAHWGSKDGQGSEHTVDGLSYEGELHIVHFNTKYGDIATAVDKPDGLAVLGMFLKVGEEHKELEKICQSLEDIQMKQDATALQDTIDPANFLPPSKSYYTYPGSLTTPPLLESVTWIVFKEPIEVSRQQIASMRGLSSCSEDDEALILENCRGACSLGDRVVTVVVEGGVCMRSREDGVKDIEDVKQNSVDESVDTETISEGNAGLTDISSVDNNQVEKRPLIENNIDKKEGATKIPEHLSDHENNYIESSKDRVEKSNSVENGLTSLMTEIEASEKAGIVEKANSEDIVDQIAAEDTSKDDIPPTVSLLVPVCIATLALAIPITVYLATRK